MKKKRLDLELMRILAIIGVVFVHTQYRGYQLYQVDGGGLFNSAVSAVLAAASQLCIPVFFMISGALLLGKNESVRDILKKRVSRIVIVLVLFSALVYCFWIYWGYRDGFHPYAFFRQLWSDSISIPYWYLYAYLSVLLMLPLLRPMAQNMTDRAYLYLMGLHVLYQMILPLMGYALGFGRTSSYFALPVAEQTIFFLLLGYWFEHRFDWSKVTPRFTWITLLLGIAGILYMGGMNLLDFRLHGEITQDFTLSCQFAPAFAVRILCHQLFEKHSSSERAEKLITTLGSCVFGTYLLEGILRGCLDGVYTALEPKLHVLPSCFLWVLSVVILGMAITYLLKKIPGIRQLL